MAIYLRQHPCNRKIKIVMGIKRVLVQVAETKMTQALVAEVDAVPAPVDKVANHNKTNPALVSSGRG